MFSRTDSTGTATPLQDALGSTIGLVDGSGNIATSYSYDPFGNTTSSGLASSNASQYTGRENDGNGLYYYRARYVETIYGRFISEDPLGFIGSGPNSYAYAFNSPTNLIDPLGLSPNTANCLPPGVAGPPSSDCVGTQKYSIGRGGIAGGAGCVPLRSLSWIQKAELVAVETYADTTRWSIGVGAGADGAIGAGPGKWFFGVSGSVSTLIVADGSGEAGIMNSWSAGGTGFRGGNSTVGGGASMGVAVMISPRSISKIKGPSGSVSATGGAVLGGGADLTTSGALTLNFGLGVGGEAGVELGGGSSTFIPFCHQ